MRVTPAERVVERVEFIEFARGFSILTIVFYHYLMSYTTGLFSKVIMLGGSGVHLFLVLSGFGLTLSVHSQSARTFYKRRFLKVLLPYYLFISIVFIGNYWYPFYPGAGLYAYLGHILGFKMFDESIVGSFGNHLWYLSVIIQFYLVFPLLHAARKGLGDSTFLTICLLVSATYWGILVFLNLTDWRIFGSSFLQYVWEFGAGMVLGHQYKMNRYEFWKQKAFTLFLIAGVGLFLMAFMALTWGNVGRALNDIPASSGYIALVALVYSARNRWTHYLVRPLTHLGRLSYELYLTHVLVFLILFRVCAPETQVTMVLSTSLIIFPVAVVVAFLFKAMLSQIYLRVHVFDDPFERFGLRGSRG